MNFYGIDMASATSASKVLEMAEKIERSNRQAASDKNKKERREIENHNNLNSLANDSQEVISLMMRQIELLEANNEKLESNLSEVTSVLKLLFDNGEMQKDHMEQMTALACQIAESLDRGEKIDWKDKAADGGVQMVISAICMALRMKGINI